MEKGDFGHEGALTGRVTVEAAVAVAKEERLPQNEIRAVYLHMQLLVLIEIRDLLESMASGDNTTRKGGMK